jgi:septal ring factor EnvC (AmiA/AmiB activator)
MTSTKDLQLAIYTARNRRRAAAAAIEARLTEVEKLRRSRAANTVIKNKLQHIAALRAEYARLGDETDRLLDAYAEARVAEAAREFGVPLAADEATP